MKYQLKVLAAAVVMASVLPAQAAIDRANTGNSSLILTVLDRVANVSASFDLGKNYADFNLDTDFGALGAMTAAGTNQTWNLTTGDYATAWSTYFTAGATLANSTYAITAGDNLGPNSVGQRGYIQSYVEDGSALSTAGLITAVGNFETFTDAIGFTPQNLYGNHDVVANGSNVANAGTALGSAFYANTGKASGTGPKVMTSVGQTMGLVQVTRGATAFAPTRQFLGDTVIGQTTTFNLSTNGTLTYNVTAVPEADTSAMLMLGLGLMGFVARRKTQA